MEMVSDDRQQGATQGRPAASTGAPPPPVLTTRALVLGGDGTLLLTLSPLAPAVAVICVPVERAHGSVSPVTDDAVAGAAGTASAGQAHGTEPAHVCALVWEGEARRSDSPGSPASPHLGARRASTGARGGEWAPGRSAGQCGHRQARSSHCVAGLGLLQEPPTLRLAPARAHFLEEKAAGSARAAHYAVVVIGDPVIPAHRCVPRRTALRPQEHLGAPRAWVHAADTAQVTAGTLAGV